MGDYDLSPEAERDLFEIALYGLENFGLARSEEYRDGLNACFQRIANSPTQHQAVDHIRQGYRRCVYRSHSIYYRIEGQRVAVMRILGRQSLARAFR